MPRIFTQGRYAAVTAALALVVALSGTAYAVATVTSADIVNNSVQGLDIKADTVASSDIKNGTVTRTDLAATAASPRLFASVNGDGSLEASAGVTLNSHEGTGDYRIYFGSRNHFLCAPVVSPRLSGGVFSAPRASISSSSGVSFVNVHVVDAAYNFLDSGFNLALFC